jgi:hypothetical protein
MRSLRALDLDSNSLTGSLPDLAGMTNLALLRMGQTSLVGTIPNHWGDLSQLKELSFWYVNGIVGTLPSSLGNLSKLTFLELYGLLLTGTVPESIGNLTSLSKCCHSSRTLFPENFVGISPVSTDSIVIAETV